MTSKKILDEKSEKEIVEKISKKIDDDVKEAEAAPAPGPTDMFDFMYDKIPKGLSEQRETFLGFLERSGKK
jgi:pyruvate dehydrogenase E1 component alpha subunit